MSNLLSSIWPKRNSDEIFVFIHLPRCAGTFLLQSFARLGKHKIVVSQSPDSKEQARQFVDAAIVQRRLKTGDVGLVAGHDTFFGIHEFSNRRPFYFTFLRDPVQRYLSNVRFLQDAAQNAQSEVHSFAVDAMMLNGKLRSLEEVVKQGRLANMLTHYLAASVEPDLSTGRWHHSDPVQLVRLAKQAIDQFDFIGFFDQLDQDSAWICKRMNVPIKTRPVNQTRAVIDRQMAQSLCDEITQLNQLDLEVVRYARTVRQARDRTQ